MKYSERDGKELYENAERIARLANPHVHHDLKDEDPLIVASERGKAEEAMEKKLEGGRFADWINGNPKFK